MPPFVDSLYLHLNKTNVRLPGENMMNARYQYLYRLTLAECLENKRRYVPAIEKLWWLFAVRSLGLFLPTTAV